MTWSSDDSSIATINEEGVITGIAAGTTTIYASFYGKTASCIVTVYTSNYHKGHAYVDLGLSVKWATCNVGSLSPEEYGDFYAWGENETKTEYGWVTYRYCNGSYTTITKYCNNDSYGNNGFTDSKTTLDPDDDVAHVKWGGDWRMPTKEEFTELLNNCTWTWTTQNSIKGYKVTSNKSGYTDRSIFLPAAGFRGGKSSFSTGLVGYYWSSLLYVGYPSETWNLYFNSDDRSVDCSNRCYGLPVRPVCQ